MGVSGYSTGMRSNLCGTVNRDFVGKEVSLCGWVNKRRDHGRLIFVDLRDFSGIVQLVFDPTFERKAYEEGKDLRNEYVIQAIGKDDYDGDGHNLTIEMKVYADSVESAVVNY